MRKDEKTKKEVPLQKRKEMIQRPIKNKGKKETKKRLLRLPEPTQNSTREKERKKERKKERAWLRRYYSRTLRALLLKYALNSSMYRNYLSYLGFGLGTGNLLNFFGLVAADASFVVVPGFLSFLPPLFGFGAGIVVAIAVGVVVLLFFFVFDLFFSS